MAFAALSRSARLAGLSAAALLALTACGGQDSSDADASASTTAPASASAQGVESSSASASSLSAAPADYEAGTCFTAPLGARDLSSFETTDCEGAHTAEYLWAVPAVAASTAAPAMAASSCAGYSAGKPLPASAFTLTYLRITNETLGRLSNKQVALDFDFRLSDEAAACGVRTGSASSTSNGRRRSMAGKAFLTPRTN